MSQTADDRALIREGFASLFSHEPSLPEAQIAHGVAVLENDCGRAWKSIIAKQSNNWGCVQRGTPVALGIREPYPEITPDGKGFLAVDTHPNEDGTSTKYHVYFRRYATRADGAQDFVRVVYQARGRGSSVLPAALRGDVRGASVALQSSGYYEGSGPTVATRVARHFKALRGAILHNCAALNEAPPAGLMDPVVVPVGDMPTIRRGSLERDAIRTWQRYHVGLAADGIFGAHTEAVTKAWQAARKLNPDGIVGPKSWAEAAK